jgi:hypothetical protein
MSIESATSAKSNKSAPLSSGAKAILSALSNASKAVKEAPAAPIFDYEARYEMIRPAFEGLRDADQKARNSVNALKEQFEKVNGNTGEAMARLVLSTIAESLGGIGEVSRIARGMASEVATAGKVSVTAGEWRKALKGESDAKPEHVSLCEKAIELRAAGKPWSEIGSALNIADSSRQQLYNVAKEFPKQFPVKAD